MITKSYSFLHDGRVNDVYTLSNGSGMQVDVLTYGARIIRIMTADKNGVFDDVTVGCKTPEAYYGDNPYFGATVGRYANRIGGAKFSLNGKTYALQANENGNILHGGKDGDFSRKIWTAEIRDDALVCSLVSPDGESGFPGTLTVTTRFSLSEQNELRIDYEAVSDKDTVCNLTNHTYFNLGGETVLDHELWINAEQMTVCDDALIPHGKSLCVKNTAFDFLSPKRIGRDILANEHLLRLCGGYDFNYELLRQGDSLELCATLYAPQTGRKMECWTTQPGVQVYTANMIDGFEGKKTYRKHCAVCLETQAFPNSPNCPNFPSVVLREGARYNHTTVYKFIRE